jgi:hypothetical protein
MSCPVCGLEIDTGKSAMITIKDGVPVEVAHVECWWTRRIRLKKLAAEEEELFGFAISTGERPKGQA